MKIKRTSKAGAGALRAELEFAAIAAKCGLSDLTVLSGANDPYRFDTRSGHRLGKWFKEQVDRFLPPGAVVHLRGLHYRMVASADVIKVNGKPYENTAADWNWLGDGPAKAGRWLGYVQFNRIIDERNAPAEVFVPEIDELHAHLAGGSGATIPGLAAALPEFVCHGSMPGSRTASS